MEIKELCARYHVPFVINDNVEIAKKIDADGVHVGQHDMEASNVRAILGPDKIIGVSAQTVEQAVLAEKNIGGISRENVMELQGTGICGIAVVSAIFAAKNITEATKELKELTQNMVQSCGANH